MSKLKILIVDNDNIEASNIIKIISNGYDINISMNGLDGLYTYKLFNCKY